MSLTTSSAAGVSEPARDGRSLSIGMVLHKPFPPDPRVAREAKSLLQAGHKVILLCLGRNGEPTEEWIDGLQVVRVFGQTQTHRFPGGELTVEGYPPKAMEGVNAHLYRYRLRLGPLRLSMKLPRFMWHFVDGDDSRVLRWGPFRLAIPKSGYLPWAWLRCNTGFFEAFNRSQFLPPFWLKAIEQFVRQYDIQALHLHDLPLVYPGLEVAKAMGIPVVADLHENWPALVQINYYKYKGFHRWTNRKSRWEAHERYCLSRADQVIVVADAAKDRLMEAGVPAQKLTVVSNVIDIDAFLAKPLDEALIEQFAGRFVLSYIGGFGPHRGIDTMLDAAVLLRKKIPNLCLFLAGADGPASDRYLTFCRERAMTLGLADITHFTGWADDEVYATYTVLSDIGVIPHKANPHTQTTMPNKLYHYMLFEKPIVCSDLIPLKAVVDETQAGLCFESGNAEDLAKQVLALYTEPKGRKAMGGSGKAWVYRKYNWQVASQGLNMVYETLIHAG